MRRKHSSRNGSSADRRQVRCLLLAIDYWNAEAGQCRDQPSKRNLRSVGFMGEHRFAEKDAIEDDTVEPARKLTVAPCLYGMSEARFMQLAVCVDDGRCNPRARLAGAQCRCAIFNDI